MVKCLIVDDEPLARKVIETYIHQISDFEIAESCQNAVEAFNILNQKPVDVIFLDINMPSINGLDFLKSLSNPPLVIITTAYREYAVEGFELNVLDYLVKPISLPRFMQAIGKISNIKEVSNTAGNQNRIEHIFVNVDKKMQKLVLDNIYYIESLKDYIRIKSSDGDYITHQTLSGITSILPANDFIRIHRSYTISLKKVSAIDGNAIEINGKLIPIGRNYIKETKSKILANSLKGTE